MHRVHKYISASVCTNGVLCARLCVLVSMPEPVHICFAYAVDLLFSFSFFSNYNANVNFFLRRQILGTQFMCKTFFSDLITLINCSNVDLGGNRNQKKTVGTLRLFVRTLEEGLFYIIL